MEYRRSACGRDAAFTLVEMIVSTAMFFIMITLLFGGYSFFMKHFRVSESKGEIHRKFLLISADFRRESLRTALESVLTGCSAGRDWICFKSNLDGDDNPHYQDEGFPMWQKYILYYTVRPPDDNCGKQVSETDDICPHKFIIKKSIDISASLDNESSVAPYLTFTLTREQAKSEPGIISVKPLAENILLMKGSADRSKLNMRLEMIRVQEASRYMKVGSVPLSDDRAGPYRNEFFLSTMPKNKEP